MAAASRAALATCLDQLAGLPPADLGGVAGDLVAVARLLGREGTLRRALSDSAAASGARRGLAEELLRPSIAAPALELVLTAVDQRWTSSLELVAALDRLAATTTLLQAQQGGVLDEVEDELFRFGRILAREPELAMALSDGTLPLERKRALLHGLLDGRAQPATVELLERATARSLTASLDRVIEELGTVAAELRQRRVATVRSPWPLPLELQDRLEAALRATFGRAVVLQIEVDPALIGGLVVQVGDELLDGSVLRRLGEARRRLAH